MPVEWAECFRLHVSDVVFNLTTEHYGFPGKIFIMTFQFIPTSFLRPNKYLFEILFVNIPFMLLYHVDTSIILIYSSKKQMVTRPYLSTPGQFPAT